MSESEVFSAGSLVSELAESGLYPDLTLIERCLAARTELTSSLLSNLGSPPDDESWLDLHAALLLIEFAEVRALPLFDELYRDPARENRLGRWLNIQIPAYGPVVVPMFVSIASDTDVDYRCRISAVDILHSVASHIPSQKPLVATALRRLLPPLTSEGALDIDVGDSSVGSNQVTFWSAIVSALITCKDEASRYQVIALYSKGYLDTDVVPDLDEYTHLLRFVDSHEITPQPLPIADAYNRFRRWDSIRRASISRSFEAHLAAAGVTEEAAASLSMHLVDASKEANEQGATIRSVFPAARGILVDSGVSPQDIPVAIAMLLRLASDLAPVITNQKGDPVEFVYRKPD